MTPKRARLGVDIFTGLVIASVALALANLSWRLMGYAGDEPVVAPLAPGMAGGGDIAPIIALAPFGMASGAAIEGAEGGLVLRAIFAATPASQSVALIAGPDGQVIPVSIGDATPGGIVEAIEPEKVTLRTSSGLRILGFDPDGPGGTNTGFASVPSPTVQSPSVSSANPPPASTPAPPPRRGATGVDAIRALIPPGARQGGDATPPPQAPTRQLPPPPPPPPPQVTPAPPISLMLHSTVPAGTRRLLIRATGGRPDAST